MGLLDLLFPKYCVTCRKRGTFLCDDCFSRVSFDTRMICLVCNRGSLDGRTHPPCRKKFAIDGAVASIAYKTTVKKLVYRFKYKPYITALSPLLTDLFYEGIIQQELFERVFQETPLLIPVPLHTNRLRKRGYNHAALLARGLAHKLELPCHDILERNRETKSQFGLSQKERKENVKEAFGIKKWKEEVIKEKTIFLVDDILTTGSTMSEIARVLKEQGAKKVYGLVLSRDE